MAKARALDKRRKSIRNIRKITRTMELIATARFKKAMDRAHAATAYTRRITQLVADLANSGLEVRHPLLEGREKTERAILLVLSANRGLCGGYNGNVQRAAFPGWPSCKRPCRRYRWRCPASVDWRPPNSATCRVAEAYTHFEDKPSFDEVELLANRYLEAYAAGTLDRLDVVYMRFENVSRQAVAVETLLPLGELSASGTQASGRSRSTSFCPAPRAFSKKSCRPVSRSSCSSAFSMPPSASKSRGWWP